ncbi:MAG: hypothetical protein IKL24_02850 [Clostridia bacterium]|nr:hypothetical protein [Clostridia bacterium]
MEKGTRLKRLLGIIFAAFVMLFAHFLYVVLSVRGTEESLLYGGIPSHFIVNIVSALAAVASLALFPVREEAEEESLDELETFWDSDLSYGDSFVDTADAREAYPELFTNRTENVSEAADTSSYLEALSMAMESQKTERIDEDSIETEENGESEWAEELEGYLRIDNEGPVVTDSLSHIPLELPEGYVPFEADAEADFAEEYDLEEWEEKKEESRFKTVIIRVAAAIAVTALPIVLAFVLSATKTLYFSSGVKVCTVFSEREYKWEDCISYEKAHPFSETGSHLSFL